MAFQIVDSALHRLNLCHADIAIDFTNTYPLDSDLGGVYMRKLAPARVSYRHDFLISYRVYLMTGLFHILLFEGTLHVDKMHV